MKVRDLHFNERAYAYDVDEEAWYAPEGWQALVERSHYFWKRIPDEFWDDVL